MPKPKPRRLRFSLAEVDERLSTCSAGRRSDVSERSPQTASRPRRRRPSGTDVELLPIRVRIPAEAGLRGGLTSEGLRSLSCDACRGHYGIHRAARGPEGRKRTEKHRRRVAQAELKMLEAVRDVRVAEEALQQMERTFARAVESSSVTTRRRLLRGQGARSLEREIETVRAHLEAKRDQLPANQKRLFRIEQRARERDAARRSARMFRLHSARHHLDCSAPLFARLMASQLELPVLVTRKDGWRWWWYRDRFWWDDEGLMATDVANIVLQTDLDRKQQSDAVAQARVVLLGEAGAPLPEEHVSESVRLAVWRRDLGRCVDCGSFESVVFDHIVPISRGGSDTAANVELRCRSCRVQLARNEMRTRVTRARIDAVPYYRHERASA